MLDARYTTFMAGNLFDVFVVGSTDPSAAGETRLAAALSAKHGVPLATVAKAISAKNLRAGQSLEQAQAQALVRQLQSIGAVTVIRTAGAGSRAATQSPTPGSTAGAPGIPALPVPSPVPPSTTPMSGRTKMATPSPGSGWPGAPSSVPGGATPSPAGSPRGAMSSSGFAIPTITPTQSGNQFVPLSSPAAAAPNPSGARNPFEPRRVVTPVIATAARPRQGGTPSPPSQASPGPSDYGVDVTPGPRLELARGDRGGSEDELSSVQNRPPTSATSLREVSMAANSGVAMDEDPKNLNLVRCVQHGLYYDKTKASGCRKCLSPAREMAAKMEAEAAGFHLGDFRRKPAKRAFLGLAFALVIGLLPAAYFCFGPGTAEASKLRVEQELLSRQPGTDEIMHRFDELDVQVGESHGRSTRNTAVVWFAVASVAMLGWYKITA
jgi:hypothetical protein